MKVGIIMGSKSDLDTMKKASAILDEFNIPYEMVIASAHRTPEAVKSFVERLLFSIIQRRMRKFYYSIRLYQG